jgi:uncharacterized RDD family membrane protein YckC
LVPIEAESFQGKRAGVVSRLAASMIDASVLLVVLTGCYLAIAAVKFLWSPRHFHFPAPPPTVLVIVAEVAVAAYLCACWMITGRTYGDRVLALRVVNRHGLPLTLIVAAVRAVLCVLVPIGLLWSVVDRQNRSLQDLVLRTSVIYDWRPGQH